MSHDHNYVTTTSHVVKAPAMVTKRPGGEEVPSHHQRAADVKVKEKKQQQQQQQQQQKQQPQPNKRIPTRSQTAKALQRDVLVTSSVSEAEKQPPKAKAVETKAEKQQLEGAPKTAQGPPEVKRKRGRPRKDATASKQPPKQTGVGEPSTSSNKSEKPPKQSSEAAVEGELAKSGAKVKVLLQCLCVCSLFDFCVVAL